MAMKTVVALPGEGIGPEVVDATCELLLGTGLPLEILTPPQGSPVPEETKRAAREADGVLFGRPGGPPRRWWPGSAGKWAARARWLRPIEAMYAEDAQLFPALSPFRLDGRAAAQGNWAGFFQTFPTRRLVARQESVQGYGDAAGTWTGDYQVTVADRSAKVTTPFGRLSGA